MAKQKETKGVPVLITTDNTKRGVFMGWIDEKDCELPLKEELEAREVRMCVYWSTDVKGVLGLAANGPSANCRISPAVKKAMIKGVTHISEISEEAVKAWRKEPWKN